MYYFNHVRCKSVPFPFELRHKNLPTVLHILPSSGLEMIYIYIYIYIYI